MNATLILVQEDGSKKPIPVKKARMVIGRKPDCTIRVPVASVSREHCEVLLEGDRLRVRDLGSSNGTYINRQRVQDADLKAGDLLAVGPAVFVTVVDGKPAEVDAAQAFASGKAPDPVSAAPGPSTRPAMPTPRPPNGAPSKSPNGATKAAPKPAEPDLDDLIGNPDDSSISDFDFDFLDEDDEDQKKL